MPWVGAHSMQGDTFTGGVSSRWLLRAGDVMGRGCHGHRNTVAVLGRGMSRAGGCAEGNSMGRGMLWEGDVSGKGRARIQGHCGQGMLWAGMPSQGTSWQGLRRAGTSGFPPSGDLADGARGHNVALRRQADQGHTLVQSGWPATRGAVRRCASAAGSGARWGRGSPTHLTSFSITSWDSEGPQTIRAMGIVCWSGSPGPGSLKSVPSCTS